MTENYIFYDPAFQNFSEEDHENEILIPEIQEVIFENKANPKKIITFAIEIKVGNKTSKNEKNSKNLETNLNLKEKRQKNFKRTPLAFGSLKN